jgi:hypothetical protein
VAIPRSRGAVRHMVEEAAYFRAQKRGFAPGHELDDWLAAEAEILGCESSADPRSGRQEHRVPGSGRIDQALPYF